MASDYRDFVILSLCFNLLSCYVLVMAKRKKPKVPVFIDEVEINPIYLRGDFEIIARPAPKMPGDWHTWVYGGARNPNH